MSASTTPSVDSTSRTDPPLQAGELQTLISFLNYHRQTFRVKTGGLTAEQLRRPLPPTDMTLGAMMKHLSLVEVSWCVEDLHGESLPEPWASVDWTADKDWDWHSASDDTPDALVMLLEESVRSADDAIARALAEGGLDTLSAATNQQTGEAYSLRWIIVHLIEEYARHNGHADLIRQSIDGLVGE